MAACACLAGRQSLGSLASGLPPCQLQPPPAPAASLPPLTAASRPGARQRACPPPPSLAASTCTATPARCTMWGCWTTAQWLAPAGGRMPTMPALISGVSFTTAATPAPPTLPGPRQRSRPWTCLCLVPGQLPGGGWQPCTPATAPCTLPSPSLLLCLGPGAGRAAQGGRATCSSMPALACCQALGTFLWMMWLGASPMPPCQGRTWPPWPSLCQCWTLWWQWWGMTAGGPCSPSPFRTLPSAMPRMGACVALARGTAPALGPSPSPLPLTFPW